MSNARRVEDELKKNLAQQKAENVKLQSQIGTLKQEKTQLQ
jgi:cell division protein FtsB